MRAVLLAATVLVLGSCSTEVEPPQPFTITVEASRATSAPGDTITFTVNMQGGSLVGVDISYGDGNADQYGTAGARSARVTFRHAFMARGSYTVQATGTDAFVGQKDASVTIAVN